MSERKVPNKYYPPDYDPTKIPRVKRKNKQNDVRIMAPFNMRCSTCGNYIANATKFNAKKETVEDQTYNSLMIFRFYIKCPRCMATIIFRTNPKEQGYEVEHGATENFMALKMAEKQAQEDAVAEEEEEKINPMKHLEMRTKASKRQMEASEEIQNIRAIKFKYNSVDIDAIIKSKRQESILEVKPSLEDDDDDVRLEAKRMMKKRAIEYGDTSVGVAKYISVATTSKSSSLTKAAPSNSKASNSLSELRKKIKIVPKLK